MSPLCPHCGAGTAGVVAFYPSQLQVGSAAAAAAARSCVLTSLAACAGAARPLCRDYVIADPPFPSSFFFSFRTASGFWQTHASSHEGAFVFFSLMCSSSFQQVKWLTAFGTKYQWSKCV